MKVTSTMSLMAGSIIIRKNDIIKVKYSKGSLKGRLKNINKALRKIQIDVSKQYQSKVVTIWLSDVISIEKDGIVKNVFSGLEVLSGITDGKEEAFIGERIEIRLKRPISIFSIFKEKVKIENIDKIEAEILNIGQKDIKIRASDGRIILLKMIDIEEFKESRVRS